MHKTAKLTRADLEWSEKRDRLFWKKVTKLSPDGCWLWKTTKARYGYFYCGNAIRRVNRIAFALLCGDIPEDYEVCHTCDNTKCVQPQHLFVGTRDDNMGDMATKGRSADKAGLLNGRRVLSPDDVMSIVAIFDRVQPTKAALAELFGVTEVNIHGILTGRIWGHLTGIARVEPGSAIADYVPARRLHEFNGRRATYRQWAEITGISYGNIKNRVKEGWSLERALTEPVGATNTRFVSADSEAV